MKALLVAFGSGIVSFLSPCVLPLVPGYLSFLTGFAPAELGSPGPRDRWNAAAPSLLFVAGFSAVFVALGASASALGAAFGRHLDVLTYVAGVVIVAMGVSMLGVLKVPWLYRESRFDLSRARSFGRAAALVMGMAFALGWTPCVGPILASILVLAGSAGEVGRGASLLFAYSLGLGVPFVITGVLFERLQGALNWLSRRAVGINRAAGAVLVLLGVLMLTRTLGSVAGILGRCLPSLD